MKVRIVAFVCSAVFSTSLLFALSKPITIDAFEYVGSSALYSPLLVDSEDVSGQVWSGSLWLKNSFQWPSTTAVTVLQTDSVGWLQLQGDTLTNKLHLLRFVFTPERYTKTQLELVGTGLFEVYVDGESKGSNTHLASSREDADPVYVNLDCLPQQYSVSIKYLSQKASADSLFLKVTLRTGNDSVRSEQTLEAKRVLTINDIIEGERLSTASVSPSGKYYIVTRKSFYAPDRSSSTLELYDYKSKQLLYTLPASSAAKWMPTSDKLYYWKKGKQEYNLVLLDAVTLKEELAIEGIEKLSVWSAPDESFFVLTKTDKGKATTGQLKKLLAPDDRIDGFRDRASLYLYRRATASLERLTFGKTNTYLLDINEESNQLLVFTTQRELSRQPFVQNNLFVLYVNESKVDTLLVNDRFVSAAEFSPDASQVLFIAHPDAFDKVGTRLPKEQVSNGYNKQAFIMGRSTGQIKPITAEFAPSIASAEWRKEDGLVYFRTIDRDYEQMYTYQPRTGVFTKLPLQEEVVSGFSLPKTGHQALYVGQSVANSSRLYAYNLKTKQSTCLADPFAQQLAQVKLASVHPYSFVHDGDTIDGRYYLPPSFDSAKQYPLIVYYYGGTTPTSRIFESRYPLQVYAALGYVVLTVQPSGTIGYGQEFAARHVNAWGKKTAEEIISGTEQFCAASPFVDKGKIACIGASYGGFMTQYLLTQTNLFAAAVSHAGISNLASYWGEGYWGYSYSSMASADSYPWNNPDLYIRQSPLFFADKIHTPLLLLHGMEDTNVPIGESIQMYNALKILNRPVEFIQVEEENHAIMSYKRRLEWNYRIFAWFAKWLKNEPEWWDSF